MTNPFAMTDTAPVAVQPTPAPAAPAAPVAPAASYGDDPFGAPAPQLPRGPRLREMYGRLLLLVPHKVEYNIPNTIEPGKFQDRMTADVIILDGGPIAFGGAPEKVGGKAHDQNATIPHKTERMFISAAGLISQSRDALALKAAGKVGRVLGRLTTGNPPAGGGNPPWILTAATDADKQLAMAWLNANPAPDPFTSA